MTARSDTAAAVAAHRDQSHRESDITPVSPPRPRRLLVEDVMSRDVVTVAPTATFHQMIGLMRRREVSALPVIDDDGTLLGIVSEADLLEHHRIKRVVVLDGDDQMVGIVSRRDLLAGFNRSDADIRADVIEGVIPRWLMIDPSGLEVEVHGGVVRIEGTVDLRSDADILAHLVRGLDGVVDVDSAVKYGLDDRDVALSRELRTD
jgi:CBS domain-containing protein